MKAFVLCAGLGTRLRELNLDVPKAMVPFEGKPLLEHHLVHLHAQGIQEFAINLHYKPEKIRDYFGDGSRWGVRISYSFEEELLGTAGALGTMKAWVGQESCLIYYGDNLTDFQLEPLARLHAEKRGVVSLLVYDSPEPWTGGVVKMDADNRVLELIEKPPRTAGMPTTISGGIFIMEPSILDLIRAGEFADFGKDILPQLLRNGQRVYASKQILYIQDVGTPERYQKAQADFSSGKLRL